MHFLHITEVKMTKNIKKGFTVVELIIVIMIIGILAAVLIPTFSSLLRTARVNADVQLIRNLNSAVAADRATKSLDVHETMHDALGAAIGFGYDVSKINASCTGNEILYDSENGVFCYFDTKDSKVHYIPETQLRTNSKVEDHPESHLYWRIINEKNVSAAFTAPDGEGRYTLSCGIEGMNWSCYLAAIPDGVTEITTDTGVDLGDTEVITAVNYVNTGSTAREDVVIRTNGEGTVLTVYAPHDSIHHYDFLDTLKITAVAGASYHEHGTVIGNAFIASGHFVAEQKAVIGAIIADSSLKGEGATAAPTVKVEGKATVGTIVVNTADEGTKVEKADDANVGTIAAGTQDAKAAMDTIAKGTTVSENLIDTTNSALFAGGLGTEASPFLVSNKAQFEKINKFSDEMGQGTAYYFKQIADIDLGTYDDIDYVIGNFCGVYDGADHSLTAPNGLKPNEVEKFRRIICRTLGTTVLKNIKFRLQDDLVYITNGTAAGCNLTLDNVDVYGKAGVTYDPLMKNTGFFFQSVGCDYSLENVMSWINNGDNVSVTIKNCDVDANMTTKLDYNAIFVGGTSSYTDLLIDNCTYTGTFVGNKVSFAIGNSVNWGGHMVVKNCKNLGTIIGFERAAFVIASDDESTADLTTENNTEGTIALVSDDALDITVDDSGYFKIKQGQTSGASYSIQLVGKTRFVPGGENSAFSFTIDLENVSFTEGFCLTNIPANGKLATVEQYKKLVDSGKNFSSETQYTTSSGDRFYIVTKDGVVYFVFDVGGNPNIFFGIKENRKAVSKIVDINVAYVYEIADGTIKGIKSCPAK